VAESDWAVPPGLVVTDAGHLARTPGGTRRPGVRAGRQLCRVNAPRRPSSRCPYTLRVPACPACGSPNADEARFCSACGERLTPADAPTPEVRKTVTIVFCDVVGSTSLAEGLDAETWGEIMVRYFDLMRAALERHGGSIEKFIGDAVMAVFGLPTAHEDDALRAVRAASEMRASLAELNERLEREFGIEIRSRTGIHTGEIVVSGAPDRPMPLGDAANTAARFEQAAGPGEILIGGPTYRLVRDAVHVEEVEPLSLKGKAEPVPAYRVLEVLATAHGVARRMGAPMVGREEELESLLHALRTTEAERRSRMVTVVGEPGVGKSRLVGEFQDLVTGRTTLLQGRCLPYGEAITFWPLAEALRGAADIRDEDPRDVALSKLSSLASGDPDRETVAEVVATAIGLTAGGVSAEEISWGFRRMLTRMAAWGPLVLTLDDLQWAATALLDLIEEVVEGLGGVPLMIVGMARPELLEKRTGWPPPHLRLEDLSRDKGLELIGNLLGGLPVDPVVAGRIAESAGGNPLFVEELIAMLVDDGSLTRTDGGWVSARDLAALDVPPTLEALLSSRLDGLPRAETSTLETAAVIGQVFYLGAVATLVVDGVRDELSATIDSLRERDLVRDAPEEFAGERALTFRHLLIRDAAYRRLPKRRRADLHEGFASWLEGEVGERVAEFEEILGYHLEQAYRYRTGLRPETEEDRRLAARAALRLASAGRRAMARGDGAAAGVLLERAVALVGADDDIGVGLLLELAIALESAGDLARATTVLADAQLNTEARGLAGILARVELEELRLRMQTQPSGVPEEVVERVPRLIAILEDEGDDAGLASAWRLMGEVGLHTLNTASATATLEKALVYAEKAGDGWQASDVRKWLVAIDMVSPTPVDESLRRIDRIVASAGGNPLVYATALTSKGLFFAMLGRFEEGRSMSRQGSDLLEDLHQTVWRAAGAQQAARIELLADDPVGAERVLRPGFETLDAMGERGYLSTVAALLAQALFLQSRLDEAERFAGVSKEACDESDVISQMLWRQSQARVLASRGELETAERLAREAVRIGGTTDDIVGHGEALVDLAEILRVVDRPGEAGTALEYAIGLFKRKGVVVLENRARAGLADLGS
jgi:class 3 adenylate cyclase/tetratricopeptide (TPR) repeat protein